MNTRVYYGEYSLSHWIELVLTQNIILPEYQRQGLGKRALGLLVEYASQVLHLHQIYAYVQNVNQPALRLFQSSGFIHTATLPQWTRCRDGWSDVKVFQMLLED